MMCAVWINHIIKHSTQQTHLTNPTMHQTNYPHIAPFCNRNVHTCAHFCYKIVQCGIWGWCILTLWDWSVVVYIVNTGALGDLLFAQTMEHAMAMTVLRLSIPNSRHRSVFSFTGCLWGEGVGRSFADRGIPSEEASDMELWRFLWC